MSSEVGNSPRSCPANGSYPASDGTDAKTDDSVIPVPPENSGRPPDLPTPEERIQDIIDEYPDRVLRPISETHDRKLRLDALEEPETVRREYDVGNFDTEVEFKTVQRDAKTWLNVIANFLEDYEEYRDRHLRMARGEERYGNYESFLINLYNSFHPTYQKGQYAKLKALKRMVTGEEPEDSPTGERYRGEFDEPVAVLFSLSASSTPNDKYRPVIDHDREIRNAWSGSSNSVKRALRYLLEDKAGLSSDEYVWWWQSEPHAGEGDAAGYSHSHPMVILDNAATDTDAPDMLDAETYRPVVAKHVSVCETAKWSAHSVNNGEESAVKVSHGDEIGDVAAYISEYIQVNTEDDLLERSDEYIMWAASQWASSTQKYSKNRTATQAITADRCHQQYRDADAHQQHDHGERVTKSDRRGVEYECNECGSTWQIDQSPETLAECNLSADGGLSVEDEDATEDGVVSFDHDTVKLVEPDEDATEDATEDDEMTLSQLWRDARAAGRVGHETVERECGHPPESNTCPLCCAEGETVAADTRIPSGATAHTPECEITGFERASEWRPEAIVQKWTGEETEIGEPDGVTYGEVVVKGHDTIPMEVCIPPRLLKQPEPWTEVEWLDESRVRSGEYPPPELIAKQLSEVYALQPEAEVECPTDGCEWSEMVEVHVDTVTCPRCSEKQSIDSTWVPIPVDKQMVSVECPNHDWETEVSIPMHREREKDHVTCPKCLTGDGDRIALPREELPETAEIECSEHDWQTTVAIEDGGANCPMCEDEQINPEIPVPAPDEWDNIVGSVAPKEWVDDWYARRYETVREPDTSVTEDDTDIDEKPPVVEDVESDLERELNEDEMKVAKRIEIVEDAHPDKGVVELSAEYDAIDHMEVVESTLHCVRE